MAPTTATNNLTADQAIILSRLFGTDGMYLTHVCRSRAELPVLSELIARGFVLRGGIDNFFKVTAAGMAALDAATDAVAATIGLS